ncbi:hypothetical protein [Microbacterium memoriense]|uniref:Uncharacterized protein n=1 Tax=Microbacterium memoriense TaxID=2978350 RepID=A0ABT2PAJ3_9MICO|nr:hypothetical protein [Microbacterium memoriense]MCT9000794.1 hypothetical protein [Microbacterium memoriense]
MTEQPHRYKRFEKARQQVAEAREQVRRADEERRTNPPLFDLRDIDEGDR